MTDKEIVERAKEAEKRTDFGELVHSPISKGVNSAFGIGFIEGMVEYRKSLQEKPISIDFEQELYKAFGQVKDFTLCMRIAKWFYDMGKNSQDPVSENLEKVADQYSQGIESDYTNDMFDRGDIYEAVIYGAQWQKTKDKSCSKGLVEYINELSKQFPEMSFAKLSRIAVRMAKWQKEKDFQYVKKECERTGSCCDNDIAIEATKRHPYYYASEMEAYANIGFKEGAMWQKQQDQSTIELAEDHAMFAGMEKMKEQMMKDAVDGVVDYPIIGCDFPNIYPDYRGLKDYCDRYKIKDNEDIKLIIIKED